QEIQKWRAGEVADLSALNQKVNKKESTKKKKSKDEDEPMPFIFPRLKMDDIKCLGYAPTVSVEPERAFSLYTLIDCLLRRSLNVETIKSLMILQWNIRSK